MASSLTPEMLASLKPERDEEPDCTTVYILPVIRGIEGTHYWWTLEDKPSYRRGPKGEAWNGPFDDYAAAQDDAECAYQEGHELLNKGQWLNFAPLPPVRVQPSIWVGRLIVNFAVSYDELSELVLLEKEPGIEHQRMATELEVDVEINHTIMNPDIWVLETRRNDFRFKVDRLDKTGILDKVFFKMPVEVLYCGKAELPTDKLLEVLFPRVRYNDLYQPAHRPSLEPDTVVPGTIAGTFK